MTVFAVVVYTFFVVVCDFVVCVYLRLFTDFDVYVCFMVVSCLFQLLCGLFTVVYSLFVIVSLLFAVCFGLFTVFLCFFPICSRLSYLHLFTLCLLLLIVDSVLVYILIVIVYVFFHLFTASVTR